MTPALQAVERAPPGSDSLRAVLDTVFQAEAYQWVERPHPLAFLGRWWRALLQWLGDLERSQPTLFWALFWVMIAVLLLIFIHAAWVMLRTIRSAAAPGGGEAGAAAEARGAAWYRGEAERLALAGRFPEAMQADFVALVLELDARRVLRFHPSKTPNEYTYEAGLAGEARDGFRGLVRSLYGYAFARWPCGPDEYAEWRRAAVAERYAAAH
ncbi:MAG: hypothetical protein SF070_03730 [Gemmatimonadota bacterium]|nr:hypothetical protein [Gemmatimonadota bacterium]